MIDKTELVDRLAAILRANGEILEAVEKIYRSVSDEDPELRRKQMRLVGSEDA